MLITHHSAPEIGDLFVAADMVIEGDETIDWSNQAIGRLRSGIMRHSMDQIRDARVSRDTLEDILEWVDRGLVVGDPFCFGACVAPYAAEVGLSIERASEVVANEFRWRIHTLLHMPKVVRMPEKAPSVPATAETHNPQPATPDLFSEAGIVLEGSTGTHWRSQQMAA